MELKDYLLTQLDREAARTRKAIDRVPEGQNDFKPHERSMPLGYLAALVANMLGWIKTMIEQNELNIDESRNNFRPPVASQRSELIAALETKVADARRALSSTTDEHLLTPWTFRINGHTVQQEPRHIMISDGVFSHLAHHRGQLTVYLRLNQAAVPALYGPSADEKF